MRLICILLVAAMATGCASYRNRPPAPSSNYWPINKAETATTGGVTNVQK